MTREELQARFNGLFKELTHLVSESRIFCQDISNSLEDRWNLFCGNDLGGVESYLHEFDNSNIDNRFREMLDMPEIYGRGAELNLVNFLDELDVDELDVDDENNISIDAINQAKEQLLAEWVKACKLDW